MRASSSSSTLSTTNSGGAKLTLIWDGLPSPRSRRMQAYVRAQRRWLVVERLPGDAPDLNPVECVWGNVTGTELANLCVDAIDETAQAAHAGIDRVRSDTALAFAFLRPCGLLYDQGITVICEPL
jgi:DDE superfamily endonuclease